MTHLPLRERYTYTIADAISYVCEDGFPEAYLGVFPREKRNWKQF